MIPLLTLSLKRVASDAGCQLSKLSLSSIRGVSQLTLVNHGASLGPGGRSSNTGATATIFGANGFVGSYVANEIAKPGTRIVCPYRCDDTKAIHLRQMGDLGQVVFIKDFDIRDEAAIKNSIKRSQIVINLIGSRVETMNWTFDETHHKWPARLAKVVAESPHVERLLHFSDLGADVNHPSSRMRSKALGDAAVSAAFPKANIIKPGQIVGIEDHFFNYLIYQLKYGLFVPLADGGANKVQPTYVADVAQAVLKILEKPENAGKTYHLGGPEVLTMRQVYDMMLGTLHLVKDTTTSLPSSIIKLLFKPKDYASKLLPELPLTSYMFTGDYVDEQAKDKVVPVGAFGYKDLDIQPNKITEGLVLEPVRAYREGASEWAEVEAVSQHVPEHIRRFFMLQSKH